MEKNISIRLPIGSRRISPRKVSNRFGASLPMCRYKNIRFYILNEDIRTDPLKNIFLKILPFFKPNIKVVFTEMFTYFNSQF